MFRDQRHADQRFDRNSAPSSFARVLKVLRTPCGVTFTPATIAARLNASRTPSWLNGLVRSDLAGKTCGNAQRRPHPRGCGDRVDRPDERAEAVGRDRWMMPHLGRPNRPAQRPGRIELAQQSLDRIAENATARNVRAASSAPRSAASCRSGTGFWPVLACSRCLFRSVRACASVVAG